MKEIFVFGAGASYASTGTPLGKDLVWEYHQDCVLFYPLGSDSKRTSYSISEEQKDFEDLFCFLQSRPEFKKYANQLGRNIKEGMVSVFDVPKRYYIDELMNDLLKKGDEEYIRLIKRLTVKHIAGSSRGIRNDLYEKFVQSLSKKIASEVSLISFNFDCWLHEDFKKGIYFDYLLDFETIDPGRGKYEKGKGVPLIKLNGSMDWAFSQNTGKKHLFFWTIWSKTYYFNQEERNDIEIPEPYIFLPHQTKDESMQILWDRAKTELKQASKVTIIGYSFPDYDVDIIKLFQENVNPAIELEVVDLARSSNEQEGIKTKYKKLFPNIDIAKVKFCFDGFEGYIEKIKEIVNGVVI